jgi:hypothetical protein
MVVSVMDINGRLTKNGIFLTVFFKTGKLIFYNLLIINE